MKSELPSIGRPSKSGLSLKLIGKSEYNRIRYLQSVKPARQAALKSCPFHHFIMRFTKPEARLESAAKDFVF
jgi:hypothetical protein